MAMEIEIKIPLPDAKDFNKVLDRLVSEVATPVIHLLEVNLFLDKPDLSLRKSDQGLRVRLEQDVEGVQPDVVVLTHKGPRLPGEVKQREETQMYTNDVAQAVAFLEALGYQQTLQFEKRRDRWLLDNCHIELDTLPLLGRFVEIEGPDEDTIQRVRIKLGLGDHALETAGYASLLAQYLKETGSTQKVITL